MHLNRIRIEKTVQVPSASGSVITDLFDGWSSELSLAPAPDPSGTALPPRTCKIVEFSVQRVSGGNYGAAADVTVKVGTRATATLTPPNPTTTDELYGALADPWVIHDTGSVNVYIDHTVVPTANMDMKIAMYIEV